MWFSENGDGPVHLSLSTSTSCFQAFDVVKSVQQKHWHSIHIAYQALLPECCSRCWYPGINRLVLIPRDTGTVPRVPVEGGSLGLGRTLGIPRQDKKQYPGTRVVILVHPGPCRMGWTVPDMGHYQATGNPNCPVQRMHVPFYRALCTRVPGYFLGRSILETAPRLDPPIPYATRSGVLDPTTSTTTSTGLCLARPLSRRFPYGRTWVWVAAAPLYPRALGVVNFTRSSSSASSSTPGYVQVDANVRGGYVPIRWGGAFLGPKDSKAAITGYPVPGTPRICARKLSQ
eukprot:3939940-Rhodomonas_salina.1